MPIRCRWVRTDLLHLYEANPDKTRVLVERGWRRPSATQGEITHAGVKLLREKGLWSPPAGMPLRYYEGAKKTKKENKMKKKSSDTRGTPTDEQLAAIRDYAAWAGRKWKDELRADWYRSGSRWPGEYYLLQQVRNNYGPEWLAKFKLEEPAARSRQGVKKHPDQRGSSTKKKSWRDVPLYHLDTGRALNEQERVRALKEYRETGGMYLIVMAEPSGRNEPDEYDRLSSAGPSARSINWAGFPGSKTKKAGVKKMSRKKVGRDVPNYDRATGRARNEQERVRALKE